MKIIITENQVKRLLINENEDTINTILDKISDYGMESLTKAELQYLKNTSMGVGDEDLEEIVNLKPGYEIHGKISDLDDFGQEYVSYPGEDDIEPQEVDIKFVYDSTEEYGGDPDDDYYRHTGQFFYDTQELWAEIFCDENFNFTSFSLHDGEDYIILEDDMEEKLNDFFLMVSDKLAKSM